MNAVAQLTFAGLGEAALRELPKYSNELQEACAEHPPHYGKAWYGEKYRSVAVDPFWMANSLIANAEKEGTGAEGLWTLAARTADADIAEQVRQHAIDEARHSKLYIKMLSIALPDAVSVDLLAELDKLSPGYKQNDFPPKLPKKKPEAVLDELIQMNIGEIRTRINQLLLRPVLTQHCPAEKLRQLERILDSLILDETMHITYTAKLIEKAINAGHGEFVKLTMRRRLAEFNDITLEEVGEAKFEGA